MLNQWQQEKLQEIMSRALPAYKIALEMQRRLEEGTDDILIRCDDDSLLPIIRFALRMTDIPFEELTYLYGSGAYQLRAI